MINPRTIAQEIAYADVATQAANLQEKQTELDAESSGLDSLSSALSDFQSAVDALNSDTDGPVTFAATSNNDSATVSANSQAQAGSYSFFVEQLAQGQQTTFSMGDDAFSATGTFELTMGDSTMDIDLSAADQNGDGDGFIDASELVNAINDSDDNPGVSAALVKTDGTTTIMLTSDSTGGAERVFGERNGGMMPATIAPARPLPRLFPQPRTRLFISVAPRARRSPTAAIRLMM